MIRVALRPQWIAFLVLVMAAAAVFAWLGKWQLERAVEAAKPINANSEIVIPVTTLITPGQAIPQVAGAQMASYTGYQVVDSFTILTGRMNQGTAGYWVVGRVTQAYTGSTPLSLPVAYGWASTEAQAQQSVATLNDQAKKATTNTEYIGRIMPAEGPAAPANKAQPFEQNTLAPAALVNQWPGFQGEVYWAYLIDKTAPAGLTTIDSKPPVDDASVNWLNIFYAIEWVVFAGFAFYIWWRMVKDAWERELEEKALAEAAATAGKPPTSAN
jgi:surfeit locus 1 family protein